MSARGVLRILNGDRLGFWCPGCRQLHVVEITRWNFSGDYDRPTFSPSILVRGRDFTPAGQAEYEAWCKRGCPSPAPRFDAMDTRCHSFVRDGQIQFLTDCSHVLAGKTVPLERGPW